MATRNSMHKRSRSDPIPRKHYKDKAIETDQFHFTRVLQREIEQLKCLVRPKITKPSKALTDELQEEDVLVRGEMEKALRQELFSGDSRNEDSIPKDAKKLVREITVLELQVMYLERYLLCLYRRIFNRKILSQLAVDKPPQLEVTVENNGSGKENLDFLGSKLVGSPENLICSPQKVLEESGIFRSHSSLSHGSGYSFRLSPHAKDLYHQSLPFSMLEQADIDAAIGTEPGYVSENIPKSPNRLSEEMIRSISSVLNQLADPNKQESYSPFHGRERTKISFPYDKLFMVKSIRIDTEKLTEVEPVLNHYRSLVHQLETANPGKLNHEEKLAFWTNIHNSLVMHSILVYGTPKSSMKRVSLMLKAAYNVGGRNLNLDTIQTSILNCRVSRPGQRLRFLFPSKPKGKSRDARKDYTINHSEPLLHFALCSGNISDPSVRIYTSKDVMQELETAKEEYIRSNMSITKDNKILLPKLVESYSKDSDLCHIGILEMIDNSLPCNTRNRIRDCRNRKSGKFSIEWVSHDFGFGLLLPQEIA